MPFLQTVNVSVKKDTLYEYAPKPKDYVWYSDLEVVMEDDYVCGDPNCQFYDEECKPLPEEFLPKTSHFIRFPVQLIKDGKWTSVYSHPNRKPSIAKKRIYARQIEKGFEIAPSGIGVVLLSYYRKPQEPYIDYDEIVSGPDVYLKYKQETSKQLEWGENMMPVFIYKLGKRFGLTTKSQLEIQVSEIEKDFLN